MAAVVPLGGDPSTSTRSPGLPDAVPVVRMKKDITLIHAVGIMTGIIIGSGIFVSPVSIVQNCGSIGLALIFWAATGFFTLAIVLCYAELAGLFPKAGGDYAYYKEILGPFAAFLNVWVQFLTIKPTFQAIVALTTVNYLLYPLFPDCDIPPAAQKLLSIWILVTVVALNSVYVRYVTRVQTFFTAVKVITLLIIIIVGIVQIAQGRTEHLQTGFQGTTTNPGNLAVAFVTGLFTYGGWNYLFNLVEEVKRPEKVVPQTSVLSMTLVIVLYVMANVAYFTVMSPQEMMQSSAVAVTFGERTVGALSAAVPILVACSTIGAMNGVVLGASRKYFAAARDNLFPDFLATINVKYLTPWASTWTTCLLACIYIITGNAVQLIEYLGFVDTFIYILALYCVLYLRYKEPHLHRSMKVPLVLPILALVAMVMAAVLGLYQQPRQNGIGVLIILSGVPAYLLGVVWKDKPQVYNKAIASFTKNMQKIFMIATQDKEK